MQSEHWIFRCATTRKSDTSRSSVSHLHLKDRLESPARRHGGDSRPAPTSGTETSVTPPNSGRRGAREQDRTLRPTSGAIKSKVVLSSKPIFYILQNAVKRKDNVSWKAVLGQRKVERRLCSFSLRTCRPARHQGSRIQRNTYSFFAPFWDPGFDWTVASLSERTDKARLSGL